MKIRDLPLPKATTRSSRMTIRDPADNNNVLVVDDNPRPGRQQQRARRG
jgi:hypothetical protein